MSLIKIIFTPHNRKGTIQILTQMKTSRVIFRIILATVFMLVFASCSKDNGDSFYRFNKEGGGKEFAIEFNGETISIQSNGNASKKPIFVEDNANPDDSQWFVELDWCRVYYIPAKGIVAVSVDENTSGGDRKATVMGTHGGQKKIIRIEQSR